MPQHPQTAAEEAFRILRPGRKLIIINLLEKRARDLYVDVWLCFSKNKLYQFLKIADFRKIEVNVIAKEMETPNFKTILASRVKS